MSVYFRLTDPDDDAITVENCTNDKGDVFASTTHDGVYIKAHKVAAVCRALYEAAGLPVPDLPDIPDPADVEALAADLKDAMGAGPGHPMAETYDEALAGAARALLARGWGRTA